MLAENLRRLLLGRQLQRFQPQATYLSIVTTGDQHAVAVKGPFCLEVWAGCSGPHVDAWTFRGYTRKLERETEGGWGGERGREEREGVGGWAGGGSVQ